MDHQRTGTDTAPALSAPADGQREETASVRLGKVPSGILASVKALERVLCVEEAAVGGVGAGGGQWGPKRALNWEVLRTLY